MRKIPLILGFMLLAILTVWETYDFFATNDGIGYFTSKPQRLLYIVGIGGVGGVAALAFSRLSHRGPSRACNGGARRFRRLHDSISYHLRHTTRVVCFDGDGRHIGLGRLRFGIFVGNFRLVIQLTAGHCSYE